MTKKSRFARVLDTIEVVGNRLPHPATLFFMMAALVALLSWWASAAGLQALHPATGEIIKVRNLLDADGIRWITQMLSTILWNFHPLALCL
jgi:aminobenzoyl-glutamate transport protein